MSLKDKSIKEIMELYEKGDITAEQAEHLINEATFESKTLKGKTKELGSKAGNILDKSKPKVKKVLQVGFEKLADVSVKMAERLKETEDEIFEDEVTSIVIEKNTSLVETEKETHLVELEKETHIINTEKDS